MSTPGTVEYPASLDDAVSLFEATNGAATTLSSNLSAVAVTATVGSTTRFPTTGAVVFGGVEIAYYTGKTATTLTGLIRGQDGTVAVAHPTTYIDGNGDTQQTTVEGRIVARHHTVLAEAVIAVETRLDSHITDAFTQAEADALYSALGHSHSGAAIVSGTVDAARLGSSPTGAKLLFGDNTWDVLAVGDLPSHPHALADVTGLITGGKITTSLLPALALSEVFPVGSQAAMLALTAERGDVAIRSDLNKSFILSTDSPGTLADWKELLTPTDAVTSINGQIGAVVLSAADVGAAALGHSHSGADILTGTVAAARLGASPTAAKLLFGDSTWDVLTAGDLPSHDHAAENITSGLLAVAQGGTGVDTPAVGDLLKGAAASAWAKLARGTALQVLRVNAGGTDLEWAAASGGGTPGGSDTQVQFNDAGAFAGDAGFTFNKTTKAVGLTGSLMSTFGAITTNRPFLSGTATWDANVTFDTIKVDIAEGSNWGASSNLLQLKFRGVNILRVGGDGAGANLHVYAARLHHTDDEWRLTNFGLKLGRTVPVQWSSTDFAAGAADTGFDRNVARKAEINNGTPGTFGDLILRNFEHTGTLLGFYNATAATKPAITGSRGANAALADLLTKMATLGLLTDSTT